MPDQIIRATDLLRQSKHLIALTGAGISVESGIPPFRGKGGVWEKFDPIKYASIDSFLENPEEIWEVFIKEMQAVLVKARPNQAHTCLARLEELKLLKTIITQNVDGLHQMAGSKDVIEFHGSFAFQRCLECRRRSSSHELNLDQIPPRCRCGGILRPEVIFFGEQIPVSALHRSEQISSICDVMLVIGTSATVQPAAFLPVLAKRSGAAVIEVNTQPTDLTKHVSDISIMGHAGEIMNEIVSQVEKNA